MISRSRIWPERDFMSSNIIKYIFLAITAVIMLILSCDREDRITDTDNIRYITWEKTIGDLNGGEGNCVVATPDGGCIITGYSKDSLFRDFDFYATKIDTLGNVVWTRRYGGAHNEYACAAMVTPDGGCTIAGSTYSFGAGSGDIFLVRIDTLGDTIWTKYYGGDGYDVAYSIAESNDGGYVVTGETNSFGLSSNIYILRLNSTGDTIWTKSIGDLDYQLGRFVTKSIDGSYFIVGDRRVPNTGYLDIYLIKIDNRGDTLWTKTYNHGYLDFGRSVAATADGGCIIAGLAERFPGGGNIFLIRVDSEGDIIWRRVFGEGVGDVANCIITAADGTFLIAGATSSLSQNHRDYLLMKMNIEGSPIFVKTYGEALGYNDAYYVTQVSDGGFVLIGKSRTYPNNVNIIKTDPNGNL